jgi:hypothetical protein
LEPYGPQAQPRNFANLGEDGPYESVCLPVEASELEAQLAMLSAAQERLRAAHRADDPDELGAALVALSDALTPLLAAVRERIGHTAV